MSLHNRIVRFAENIDAFRSDPLGVCLVGRSWIHFAWSHDLRGLVLFGRPDREDARAMARSLALEFESGIAAHAFYVDARNLDGVDPDAFVELVELYRDNLTRAAKVYTRLGLIIPNGVEGAIVTGFYGSHVPPFPFRIFRDPSSAGTWLGAPSGLDGQLMAIVAAQYGASPIVLALRNLLAAGALDEPAAISRTLGMSSRTLQRRLQEAGTSLHQELGAFRIEAAKKRLTETDTPVTVIALDLGFATPQHFSRQFRKATGIVPTAWRARFRGPAR